jgi:hypothetical protein
MTCYYMAPLFASFVPKIKEPFMILNPGDYNCWTDKSTNCIDKAFINNIQSDEIRNRRKYK